MFQRYVIRGVPSPDVPIVIYKGVVLSDSIA